MTIRFYEDLEQGSDAWLAARCGVLTASEVKLILSPSLKITSNDKERSHLYELLAQRITRHVEPHFMTEDMMRGHADEIEARIVYADEFAAVTDMGFITNDRWGFTLGYSPDGLVGDDGLIECKSRRQKYQIQTICERVMEGVVPDEYLLQVQTGLLVSERKWLDFISYSGGLPMVTIRVYPDEKVQQAIVEAAGAFERRLQEKLDTYTAAVRGNYRLIPTERRQEQEITI